MTQDYAEDEKKKNKQNDTSVFFSNISTEMPSREQASLLLRLTH